MGKEIEEIPLVSFNLDQHSGIPLYKQLYDLLRKAITEGRLKPGQKLPGTRSLAGDLSLSRNTVALAFNQLLIEGYIKGMTGSGTYVNEIPEIELSTKNEKEKVKRTFSTADIAAVPPIKDYGSDEVIPFQTGTPAIYDFPIKTWLRIVNRVSQTISAAQLGYGDAAGYYPLREAIAGYISTYRAVKCTPEQIIIINGSQQGLDLIGRLFLKPGKKVWLEDPGYFGARSSIMFAHADVLPSPIDEEGLDLKWSIKKNSTPDLIYTTPSHQFPLGVTMSISRRLELLEYAKKSKCWIIEDDYDGEFRYSGNPLPSLQGMDTSGRVFYLGTFSKVLFPGLRLGYLVLPNADMIKTFASAKYMIDRQCPIYEQIVLSRFIEEGHFTRHIRKMRVLYKSRQDELVRLIRSELKGAAEADHSPAGMHLILRLPDKVNDKKAAQKVNAAGVVVRGLSEYSIKYFHKPALILGYTAFTAGQMKAAVLKMAAVLRE